MKFGPVSVQDALGGILAHSERIGGRKLAKGTVLGETEIANLRHAGLTEVVVARLEDGDVGENEAAQALAGALAQDSEGLRLSAAGTGRVNLVATGPGLVALDAPSIDAANRIDPGLTIATVPRWQRLAAGGLAATVKVIPYGVAGTALEAACAAAKAAMTLKAPVLGTASLIETRIGVETPASKGRQVTEARLGRFGVSLTDRWVVSHAVADLAAALAGAPGELLLILTGSATADVADTAPAALVAAGGRLIHYGMPVDPGNLLFVGDLGGRPVIGLPGCARSPAMNGADWVLERLVCGVPVGAEDIMAMGVGGLLKEIPERGHPRRKDIG